MDMTNTELIFGIAILIFAVFLILAVLMQHGKSKHLSGSIAGGAETFFGKEKGKTIDRILSRVTTVVAIVFVAVVILLYTFQDYFLFR
jgi:preprotein translocase subunit SecG